MSSDEENASPSWKARLLKILPWFRSETVDEQPEEGNRSILSLTVHRSQVFPGPPLDVSQDHSYTPDKDGPHVPSPISETCTYSINTSHSVRTFADKVFDFLTFCLEIAMALIVVFGIGIASKRGLTFIHELCLARSNA